MIYIIRYDRLATETTWEYCCKYKKIAEHQVTRKVEAVDTGCLKTIIFHHLISFLTYAKRK
jgi:hypothetical protein